MRVGIEVILSRTVDYAAGLVTIVVSRPGAGVGTTVRNSAIRELALAFPMTRIVDALYVPLLHEERFNRNGCCSTQCSDTVRLVASYGLTIEQYRGIYEAQEGKCAICGKHAAKLRIDHHHGDGMVRGLLCNECNLGLGLFRDSSLILQRAAGYIDGRL
jgi:hypothetical protein